MMAEFLIGFEYHYPESYELWNRGIVEDFEAATGVFISADSIDEALQWGSVIGTSLLNFVNKTTCLTMQQFQHGCWHEVSPTTCNWSHCLEFFQHVNVSELPDFDRMTSTAYVEWEMQQSPKTS